MGGIRQSMQVMKREDITDEENNSVRRRGAAADRQPGGLHHHKPRNDRKPHSHRFPDRDAAGNDSVAHSDRQSGARHFAHLIIRENDRQPDIPALR
ncbi:hypothetical protein SDC9_131080 [bioreactor metagenome]|uniref:Uncharacterized protein n=1 Tax=bioreactor metagenome TaxID=1076179 RepID=A0A645D3E7_9ZZZZ